MPDYSVTVRVANAEAEDAPIRVADFVAGVRAIRNALRTTDAEMSGGAPSVDWQLAELTYSSPARVTVEPLAEPESRAKGGRVVAQFLDYAQLLSEGQDAPPKASRRLLEAFADLADPAAKGRVRVELINSRRQVSLPPEMAPNIRAMLAPEFTELGSVEGHLEFYNIHGSKNVFRIYPVVGPSYVECRFKKELREEAQAAIGERVRVFGRLHYRERDPFPYRADVKRLEPLPPNHELPSLLDLKGMAREATGGVPSEVFVRELRSGQG